MNSKNSLSGCLTIIAIFFTGGIAISDESASSYSLEEAVAALTDRLSSIESLECEYSIHYDHRPIAINCRSARSGTMWRYAELSTSPYGERKENIVCRDDSLLYTFVLTRPARETIDKWSSVQLHDPRGQENLDPDYLLGIKLSNVSRSIVDVLKSFNVTKSEEPLSDGTTGVRLLSHAVPSAIAGSKMKYDVAIMLDPKHDFLPTEILITESNDSVTSSEWEQRWRNIEFQQILDERTNRQRWFPVSALLTQGIPEAPSAKMIVKTVRINHSIPIILFRPEIPDGTTVADVTSDSRGRLAIKGGHWAASRKIEELTDRSRAALGGPRPMLFVLNIVAVIALALVFYWRKYWRFSK